jgi:hypothetical protein
MIQDRLNSIKEYFQSLEQYDGKWVICVNFKEKWVAYTPENGKIKAVGDEKVPNRFWYAANSTSVTLDDIIDLIEETIETNIDAIKKAELFKTKISELKVLFSRDEYNFNKLKTLKFVFDDARSIVNNEIEDKKIETKKKNKTKSKKDAIQQLNSDINDIPIAESINQSVEFVETSKHNEMNNLHETKNASELSNSEIDDLRG